MVLNIVYMMSKLCNVRHRMHDIRAKLEHTPQWGNRTGHLSLNPSLRSYQDPTRDLLRQVALSTLKALFSLQNFPSPCQMADAHEEQLNVLTLLTNVICNEKRMA